MEYYIVFLLLSLLTIVELKFKVGGSKGVFHFSYFIILLVFIGLRDETGTDWISYYTQFQMQYSQHMEFGYQFLSGFFSELTSDYNAFVFFHAFIYLSVFFYAIRYKSKVGYIVLLIYTGHLIGSMGSNRQILALMICILSAENLFRGNNKTFVFLVLLASTIHYSALIFFLAPFILKFSDRVTLRKLIVFLLICTLINIILSNSEFVNLISSYLIILFDGSAKIHGQLIVYSSDQFRPDISISLLMVLKRILTFLFVILMIYMFINRNVSDGFSILGKRFKFYVTMYFFSILLVLIFQPIFPILATRGSMYFYIYEIFLFSLIVSKLKNRNYLIISLFFITFCFVRLQVQLVNDQSIFIPYKAIWYNEDVIRNLY